MDQPNKVYLQFKFKMRIQFTDIKQEIVRVLEAAENEILVAVSWLTDKELFGILTKKLLAGVKVSIITRNDYLNNHAEAFDWSSFIDSGGQLRFCKPGMMLHYKFAIADRKTVMATSYNWCCFAGSNNRENILIFDDEATIEKFIEEFNFLSKQFLLENKPERIEVKSLNPKLLGFYELTISDDLKNQKL